MKMTWAGSMECGDCGYVAGVCNAWHRRTSNSWVCGRHSRLWKHFCVPKPQLFGVSGRRLVPARTKRMWQEYGSSKRPETGYGFVRCCAVRRKGGQYDPSKRLCAIGRRVCTTGTWQFSISHGEGEHSAGGSLRHEIAVGRGSRSCVRSVTGNCAAAVTNDRTTQRW